MTGAAVATPVNVASMRRMLLQRPDQQKDTRLRAVRPRSPGSTARHLAFEPLVPVGSTDDEVILPGKAVAALAILTFQHQIGDRLVLLVHDGDLDAKLATVDPLLFDVLAPDVEPGAL